MIVILLERFSPGLLLHNNASLRREAIYKFSIISELNREFPAI